MSMIEQEFVYDQIAGEIHEEIKMRLAASPENRG
jgi:hypothetical protein